MDRRTVGRTRALAALRLVRALGATLEAEARRWWNGAARWRGRRARAVEEAARTLEAPATPPPVIAPAGAYAGAALAPRRALVPAGAGAPSEVSQHVGTPDVVVVDDDPAIADMLRYALRASGFSFHYYSAGPEALAALLSLDTSARRPVVLLDADLPGLDGFSLHERLQAERPGAYAAVFLSARTGEAEQLRAYRSGALDYLAKPVNMRILMAKVPLWVARSARPT